MVQCAHDGNRRKSSLQGQREAPVKHYIDEYASLSWGSRWIFPILLVGVGGWWGGVGVGWGGGVGGGWGGGGMWGFASSCGAMLPFFEAKCFDDLGRGEGRGYAKAVTSAWHLAPALRTPASPPPSYYASWVPEAGLTDRGVLVEPQAAALLQCCGV